MFHVSLSALTIEVVEEQKLTKIMEVNDARKQESNKNPYIVTVIEPDSKLGYQVVK